ncbi:uncharacterized protein LOC111038965 [Myzus persicae]|uniref:uncharacterized protein LOC111038965 n=1 Tax=Myzus persicae TaxID=13164 RepID=UPI000B939ED6|nr:uncharacterized protein LOC111038965 [Myzus persicae]
MEKKFDYASLLKSARNLKHTIDELVCKNHNEIDVMDIECMRKLIENILKKYELDAKHNNGQQIISNCDNVSEINHNVQSKTKGIIDVSSSCCTETITMKCNEKKKMEDNEDECRNITNEDNGNKRQNDFHEKCESQLKFYEEYVKELECRLKGFIEYMIEGQRSDQKHITREIYLKSTIEKMKRTECYYKGIVQRLSEKLDYARKKSEERQKWIDGLVSKAEQLRCAVEKNAMNSAELAKTLSSFAVDLSVSNLLQHPEEAVAAVVACDDRNRVANPSGSSEIVDNGASGCSRSMGDVEASVQAVVDETLLRPMLHSTPIRDLPCRRDCRCSFSADEDTDDEDTDDEEDDDGDGEEDDHPSDCFKTAAATVKCRRPKNDEPSRRCSKLFRRSQKSTDVNNSGTETAARCVGGSKLTKRSMETEKICPVTCICCCNRLNSTEQQS